MSMLRLTVDHIQRIHRVVDDGGFMPGTELHTDARHVVQTHPPLQLTAGDLGLDR